MSSDPSQRWRRTEELFEALLGRNATERETFLAAHCGDDDALRLEVESLLEAHDRADFFDTPAKPDAELPAPSLRPGSTIGPYRLERVLGRGGMGTVYEAVGGTPEARVAVKVVRAEDLLDAHRMRLFQRETQSLQQLDHEGIAALLDQGETTDGQCWYAMELVNGTSLSQYVRERRIPRIERLKLFVELCAAIEYAHRRGVVHRDLKPSNVFIVEDARGHPHIKVLDFGLARFEGALAESATTEPGRILGTLAYMSPEQARGDPALVGPQSDVYALGVILYELLTGVLPIDVSVVLLPEAVRLICEREPERPSTYDHALRGNLDTITMRALEKEPRRRYLSVASLAEDVSRHLDGRRTVARPPGKRERIARVVGRHRLLFGSAGALIALALGAAIVTGVLYARASRAERLATQRANDVLSLSAIQELKELDALADELWPATPSRLADYEKWLASARILVEGRAADPARAIEAHPSLKDHEAKLLEIRRRARPSTRVRDVGPANAPSSPGDAASEAYEFDDAGDRWWYAQLSQLVSDLRAFSDERTGTYSAGISDRQGWGIVRRAEFARTIEERTITGSAAAQRWEEAIRAVSASGEYGGLVLVPQLGLLPIGPDRQSHLWEFAHLQTGEPALRDKSGKLVVKEETGLVFVLIPGGSFRMGAQTSDPAAPNYDPRARPDEAPVHTVTLAPFFLSKYEMTQGQWRCFSGRTASQYGPHAYHLDWNAHHAPANLLHPVDHLNEAECRETLTRLGLLLPTEAQWEYAARARTVTPWWTGTQVESLQGAGNLADVYGKEHGAQQWTAWEPSLDDGHTIHAPVGSFRANGFGLHDVIGNVMEWCRDGGARYEAPVSADDGAQLVPGLDAHIHRGGGFNDTAIDARSSDRSLDTPGLRHDLLGVRPARRIDP